MAARQMERPYCLLALGAPQSGKTTLLTCAYLNFSEDLASLGMTRNLNMCVQYVNEQKLPVGPSGPDGPEWTAVARKALTLLLQGEERRRPHPTGTVYTRLQVGWIGGDSRTLPLVCNAPTQSRMWTAALKRMHCLLTANVVSVCLLVISIRDGLPQHAQKLQATEQELLQQLWGVRSVAVLLPVVVGVVTCIDTVTLQHDARRLAWLQTEACLQRVCKAVGCGVCPVLPTSVRVDGVAARVTLETHSEAAWYDGASLQQTLLAEVKKRHQARARVPSASLDTGTTAAVFLPIHEVYKIGGVGSVVCGTPVGGTLRPGDTLFLQPYGTTFEIRSIECFHHSQEEAPAGSFCGFCVRPVSTEGVDERTLDELNKEMGRGRSGWGYEPHGLKRGRVLELRRSAVQLPTTWPQTSRADKAHWIMDERVQLACMIRVQVRWIGPPVEHRGSTMLLINHSRSAWRRLRSRSVGRTEQHQDGGGGADEKSATASVVASQEVFWLEHVGRQSFLLPYAECPALGSGALVLNQRTVGAVRIVQVSTAMRQKYVEALNGCHFERHVPAVLMDIVLDYCS